MPIYDYQCSACGFKDEVMRKISAPNTEACPKCAASTFSKQLSAPAFQLSGSGWYATDFKNGSTKPAKPETSDSAKTSEAKVESVVEKKSDAAPSACATGCACH